MRIIQGLEAARSALLQHSAQDWPAETQETVRQIIQTVRAEGDKALLRYGRTLDGVELSGLEVTRGEIAESRERVSGELLNALTLASERIRGFHVAQREALGLEFSRDGMGFVARPLQRVGIYVPGGKAAYPSTVLMTAIPARSAGVDEVVMTTPPAADGTVPAATLAAADIAGVDRVFKIGGAQAIAALAFGTESVPKVDKVCGPGNIFVTIAKKQVYGAVAIDGLHGPTETVVLADETADPAHCASDLLAQAEHDEMASAILITDSADMAERIAVEVDRQLADLERRDIARQSLERNGAIVVLPGIDEALDLANELAPEHLCVATKDARARIGRIRNAGGVFIDTPEALGDYTAGPSHVMPTGGTARFSSPLSVLDFLKLSMLVDAGEKALEDLGPAAAMIARAEGLTAHARSIEKRLKSPRGPEEHGE
jgi:histidinol dehydrogenase